VPVDRQATQRVGGHSTDSGQRDAKFPSMRATSSTKGMSVCGARRIWGTLKATTTRAVEKVISTFSTTPVTVKRKYKSFNTPGSITKKSQQWWFVVRAEESVLVQLERDWESIEVQTGWQLTPLLHYVAVTDDVTLWTLIRQPVTMKSCRSLLSNQQCLLTMEINRPQHKLFQGIQVIPLFSSPYTLTLLYLA
jgi:hypothetical protein